jgi:hypothetical protein
MRPRQGRDQSLLACAAGQPSATPNAAANLRNARLIRECGRILPGLLFSSLLARAIRTVNRIEPDCAAKDKSILCASEREGDRSPDVRDGTFTQTSQRLAN